MKKLMIAAAIAMTAICSQAVSVNWSTGLLGMPTSAKDGTPSTTLIGAGSAGETWLATLYIYDAAGENLIASDSIEFTTYLNSKGKVKRSFTGGKGEWDADFGAMATTDLTDVDPSTAYQWKLIVEGKNIDGSYDASKEMALQSVTTKGAAAPTPLQGANVTGWTSQKWEVASVPEPTSGLLLLLGVAGLALRRRRA